MNHRVDTGELLRFEDAVDRISDRDDQVVRDGRLARLGNRDLKQTVTNARKLTARIDAVGGDIEQLTDDRQFMQGLRSVMIGLGAFFDEVYPAKTGTSN